MKLSITAIPESIICKRLRETCTISMAHFHVLVQSELGSDHIISYGHFMKMLSNDYPNIQMTENVYKACLNVLDTLQRKCSEESEKHPPLSQGDSDNQYRVVVQVINEIKPLLVEYGSNAGVPPLHQITDDHDRLTTLI